MKANFYIKMFLVFIFPLMISCDSKLDMPPVYNNSFLFFDQSNDTLKLLCGGIESVVEGKAPEFPSEVWQFKNGQWSYVPGSCGGAKNIRGAAFDSNSSHIYCLSLSEPISVWCWNGKNWVSLQKGLPLDTDKNSIIVYSIKRNRIELYDFFNQRLLFLNKDIWQIDNKHNVLSLPECHGIGISYTSHSYYNSYSDRLYIYNPLPEYGFCSDIFDLVVISEGKQNIIGYFPENISNIEAVTLDKSKNRIIFFAYDDSQKEFSIYEFLENEFVEKPSINSPSGRMHACFIYSLRHNGIVMYGGYGDSDGLFGLGPASVPCPETWLIKYSEKESSYIWEQLD
jgi:hypothetical protein